MVTENPKLSFPVAMFILIFQFQMALSLVEFYTRTRCSSDDDCKSDKCCTYIKTRLRGSGFGICQVKSKYGEACQPDYLRPKKYCDCRMPYACSGIIDTPGKCI